MRQEKTVATNDGLSNFNERSNYKQSDEKTQFVFNFGKPPKITVSSGRKLTHKPLGLRDIVCRECCLPLHIYGKMFIESYLDERAELLPSLCDLHLAEMEAEVTS